MSQLVVLRITPERILDMAAFLLLTPGFIAAIFGDHDSERISEALSSARRYLASRNISAVVRDLFVKTSLGAVLDLCMQVCIWLVLVYEVIETIRAIYLGVQKPPIHASGFAAFVQHLPGLPRFFGWPVLAILVGAFGYFTAPAFFGILAGYINNLREGKDGGPSDIWQTMLLFGPEDILLGWSLPLWYAILCVPALLIIAVAYFAAWIVVSAVLLVLRGGVGIAALIMQVRWRRIAFLLGVLLFVFKDLVQIGPP
jgi:hypothetical protein